MSFVGLLASFFWDTSPYTSFYSSNYLSKTVHDKNIIHLAAENNFCKFVDLNGDKTKTGDTSLHCALEKKYNDFVKILLVYNANVKTKKF